ncbi:MAG: fibronectin type III domain-containing protein [Candidatus Hydrogenedentota bacterium]
MFFRGGIYSMRYRDFFKVLMVLILGVFLIYPITIYAEKYTAKVTDLVGDADYKVKDSEKWESLTNGIELQEGDKVRTKFASKLRLEFADGSEVFVRENSMMDIKILKDTKGGDRQKQLKMWIGNVRAKVQPLPTEGSMFEVATPTSVAGVRGTDFTMNIEKDGTTMLYVRDGQVNLRNVFSNQEVNVGQFQQSLSMPTGDVTPPEKAEDPDANVGEEEKAKEEAQIPTDTGTAVTPEVETTPTDETIQENYVIMVSEPASGTIFATSQVKVAGIYGANQKIIINDISIICGADGSYSEIVTLAEGDNKIIITNEDKTQSQEIPVVIDTIKPDIQIISIIPSITNQSILSLSLNTEANSIVKIGDLSLQTASGVVNHQHSLVEGMNNIQIIVTDKAGNISEKTIQVELDSIAPTLTISQILVDNATGKILVSGIVEAGAIVTANGYPLEVNANGSFSSTIDWATSGDVTFEAKDGAGNITREVRTPSGAVDNDGPTLQSITFSPSSVTVGEVSAVTVTVVASDASGLINSTEIALTGPTGRTLQATLSLAGVNSYTGILSIPTDLPGGIYSVSSLTLTDAVGNSSSVSSATTLTVVNTAPDAPSDVSAVDAKVGGTITLTWRFNTTNQDIAGLRLYQSMASGGPYSLIANLSSTQSLYEIKNLINGTPYYFILRSYDFNGNESLNSNEASDIPSDQVAPSAPSGLKQSDATTNSVTISWSPSSEASSYKVYRSLSAGTGGPWMFLGQTSSSSYTVTGLAAKTTYYFAVTALDDNIAPPTNQPNESSQATCSATTN